ncbi:unnamed protein product [Lepeophtheirus salmonis]|uniref:(salmon louse) hypothetical protein n=1 Tax=Lepeophtheirus salmonis TaxID=72036 RepID=A0A7R8D6A7_LEPSM|nr:unnamed protein product [Lepeophtheirus salmonis]CAF3042083.1 unnamed protein product [Lepeophtheirus salmonis]
MRKVSVPGPQIPTYTGGSSSNGLKSLKNQSSFDLSHRKISGGGIPPLCTNRVREKRISIIVSGPDPNRRISSSSANKPHTLLALQQTLCILIRRLRISNNQSSSNLARDLRESSVYSTRKPLFQPSLEASSKFKKKLRTKTEETQSTLLDIVSKLNFEVHELKSRTEEYLEREDDESSCKNGVEESDTQGMSRMGNEDKSEINSNLRLFCLTTFKILTLVNECYELVKSIQSQSSAPSSLNTSSLLSQGTLLSESFRNHDFGKDISVSYFGLDWKELTDLVHEIESHVRSLYISSRKSSLEHFSHYYRHHVRKTSNGGQSISNSTDLPENPGSNNKSLPSLCVSICKDLRKVRDDVLSHTEAVLRGRLSPVNKQIICEEQNRFRAYNMISSFFSHSSPLERKGSFTGRIMSLFHGHGQQKKKQPPMNNNVWSEWFEKQNEENPCHDSGGREIIDEHWIIRCI